MASQAQTLSVILAVIVGATIVRCCDYAEHRLRREKGGTGFLDVLVPGDDVKYSDYVWIALPPIAGGMILAFWPGTNGGVAGASGSEPAVLPASGSSSGMVFFFQNTCVPPPPSSAALTP